MELVTNEEPDRLTNPQLEGLREHWQSHYETCMRGANLAIRNIENIDRQLEVQQGLGVGGEE